MKSEKPGSVTSPEVSNVSPHGVWLLWDDREFYLDYDIFPWFKAARIPEIFHVVAESDVYLYWPDFDIDLSRKIIENPELYSLISRG